MVIDNQSQCIIIKNVALSEGETVLLLEKLRFIGLVYASYKR